MTLCSREFSNYLLDNQIQISDKDWNSTFIKWFKKKVASLNMNDKSEKMDALLSLSRGPSSSGISYKVYYEENWVQVYCSRQFEVKV
ncbi:hypothetical protein LINPERHAP1_LOCUS15866 [Linum perenne]